MRKAALSLVMIFIITGGFMQAQELQTIKLPAPTLQDDKPLMQALEERKSSREFSEKELSQQDLSNILWAANGINRPETGHRTSPSARNIQDIDIYTILKDGAYRYDPRHHELVLIVAGDYRKDAGMQGYVATAPLNLIYVSDLSKMSMYKDHDEVILTAGIDAGHCSQNVYLYGAAAGLGVVVRTSVDREKLAEILKLKSKQMVIMGQTVGFWKK